VGVKDSGRLLIVSNRLPATVRVERRGIRIVPSTGGLATGVRSAHERTKGLWFGWPGALRKLAPRQRAELDQVFASRSLVPIHLSQTEVRRYYHGFSNGVLWPLFHYATERLPLENGDWSEYQRINERFADAVAKEHRKGDLVWIHDYQLALVPAMLRERIPSARIAFFLHIPFPSSEVFRILPRRAEILRGILGADVVGFHTLAYLRHFSMSLLRILGLETSIDRVWHEEREVRLGVHPMGVDCAAFDEMARDERLIAEAAAIRRQAEGAAIVLGIDRLDYSKGIPERLLAYERLLEREPDLREHVRFIQVAAPSRAEVTAYAEFERTVDELVGRINGRFGTPRWAPIHYVHQSVSQRRVVALYLAADVLAVTPHRDGLNLVAKEYVAARPDRRGVLVLSEFAGAASEMAEALLVNPHDVDAMADALSQALHMDEEERKRRCAPMRERLFQHDIHHWTESILHDLRSATEASSSRLRAASSSKTERVLHRRMRDAERLVLFLDYDGTLVPLAPHPDLAAPDPELLELLGRLSRRPGTAVHLVSGRDRTAMEKWFGDLPLALHAEHGLWTRAARSPDWAAAVTADADSWKAKVRPLLETFTRATPGSFIEEKSAGLAWHYARAEREFGPSQALEMRLHLIDLLSNAPVQVVTGERVVEIRTQGVDKGSIVARTLASEPETALPVAFGDDVTDEELFGAIPERGIAVHVGPSRSRAAWRIREPRTLRKLLGRLVR
jgi:trehalose 6-phosphate synthase/phosphatase